MLRLKDMHGILLNKKVKLQSSTYRSHQKTTGPTVMFPRGRGLDAVPGLFTVFAFKKAAERRLCLEDAGWYGVQEDSF